MEERITYSEIKAWLLESFFISCRDRGGHKDGWTHETIVADVYDGFTSSFDHPVEYLMLEVVALVLVGNWYSAQIEYHHNVIKRLLESSDLNSLLTAIPNDEAEELKQDMRILKII